MTVWQPGIRCVCVDDSPATYSSWIPNMPVKGRIYTVRDVEPRRDLGLCGLRLEEISNPKVNLREGFLEPVLGSWRFRPLSETRLDQFRAHLAPAPRERVAA